ncbi:MAG: hypothetical protein ACRDXX_07880, partial [Stackebrandtia sp.]
MNTWLQRTTGTVGIACGLCLATAGVAQADAGDSIAGVTGMLTPVAESPTTALSTDHPMGAAPDPAALSQPVSDAGAGLPAVDSVGGNVRNLSGSVTSGTPLTVGSSVLPDSKAQVGGQEVESDGSLGTISDAASGTLPAQTNLPTVRELPLVSEVPVANQLSDVNNAPAAPAAPAAPVDGALGAADPAAA